MRTEASVLNSLNTGEIQFRSQFAFGSNRSFLVDVGNSEEAFSAVYKPFRGEQPLWDFPSNTLALREVAAYITSKELLWDLVPPTVLRQDGPGGGGSLQLYMETEPSHHYFTFSEDEKQMLRPVVLFDVLINNADRKGGHIILTSEGRIRLIDHGVCFHEDYKLRTVIWDFAGEAVPLSLLDDLRAFAATLDGQGAFFQDLAKLLSRGEIQALQNRNARILRTQRFPEFGPRRNYPWPLI